ncbi:mobilization protein MbpA [uncultured Maribacter sp.]|uniref:mobilization protein MbpA n=1 Tax=uncultured Maribacter sp. TaxID=431308 RepID=UPI0030D92B25|tara:strand:+ start:4943 stop:5551 length:609 start_codon:yes stop_codon:yes gene_type:complete
MELGRGYDPRNGGPKRERNLKLERKLERKRKLEQKLKREEDTRHKEMHTIHLSYDMLLEQDSLSLKIEPDLKQRNESAGSNSRWVSVDTILTTPEGRSSKKQVNIKDEIIKFRCTAYEKKLLIIKAKTTGLTLSEYFRRVAFEQKIIERLSDSEIEIYQMLVKYHNNFKMISNSFKKKDAKLTQEILEVAKAIKEQLKKFDP